MASKRKHLRDLINEINGQPSKAVYVMVAGSAVKIGVSARLIEAEIRKRGFLHHPDLDFGYDDREMDANVARGA